MDHSACSLSTKMRSLKFHETTNGRLPPHLSYKTNETLKLPAVLNDPHPSYQGTLPSLSELGILDLHKRLQRSPRNNRPLFSGSPPSFYARPARRSSLRAPLAERHDTDFFSYTPERTPSPVSVYSSTSEMTMDNESTDSVEVHSPGHRGPYRSRSLNSTPFRRADDNNDAWLAHAVLSENTDRNGGPLYKCIECPHEQTKQALKRHVNDVHLNKRPWDCETCGQKFKQKTSLMIHVYSKHTGERPYECRHPNCGESFSDPARRNKHTKRCHPDMPSKSRPKVAYPSQR